jgi:hypothetical protein
LTELPFLQNLEMLKETEELAAGHGMIQVRQKLQGFASDGLRHATCS